MKHKIWIANILLTRRCNLACSYCNIIKNYDDMPGQYPHMTYYRKRELSAESWIEIIKKLKQNNPECFFIFYGGEPTKYRELGELLEYCNKNEVYYTVITNNTEFARKRIYDIVEQIGKLRGITSSVDPVALMNGKDDDISLKSKAGLHNLAKMKKNGIADDVVAEITITKESVPFLIDTVEQLSDNGIYSSITAIDDQKTNYYDFSNVGEDALLEKTQTMKRLFDTLVRRGKSGDLLIHIPELLNNLYDALPSSYRCDLDQDVHNVTIEPNGEFRLCLRVKGTSTSNLSITESFEDNGDLTDLMISSIRKDHKHFCKGCNWTCPIMSSAKHRHLVINH